MFFHLIIILLTTIMKFTFTVHRFLCHFTELKVKIWKKCFNLSIV